MKFVAIGLDGKAKSVENWNVETILNLLHQLKNKRVDLYEMLESHFTKSVRGDCGELGMCKEPSIGERMGMARSKKIISFDSKLQSVQIEVLVDLVNELHIFSEPKTVTKEILVTFFQCETTGLRVRNLRLFCALMPALANHECIGQYWQAPIYRNHLLLAPQKNGYVNRRDLAFANYAINNVVMDCRIERINHVVRSLMI